MADPKCSQLPCPLHKIGAIRMINTKPTLARNRSKPVSRYLLRNWRAAISRTLSEHSRSFNLKVDRAVPCSMLKSGGEAALINIARGAADPPLQNDKNR